MTEPSDDEPTSFYEAIGGADTFHRLVGTNKTTNEYPCYVLLVPTSRWKVSAPPIAS